MVHSCIPSTCFPTLKSNACVKNSAAQTPIAEAKPVKGVEQIVEACQDKLVDSQAERSPLNSVHGDCPEPSEEPNPEMDNARPNVSSETTEERSTELESTVPSVDDITRVHSAQLFVNAETASTDHYAASEASKVFVSKVVTRVLDRQPNGGKALLADNRNDDEAVAAANGRDRTESELAKVIGLRRAGTTDENCPQDSWADARAALGPTIAEEVVPGGLAVAIGQAQPERELAAILELRRAGTTYENNPANAGDVSKEGGLVEQVVDDAMLGKPATLQRFDFGVGLARCVVCKSLPRCNRGCSNCKERICRRCFMKHECPKLASVHELASDNARSTPSISV